MKTPLAARSAARCFIASRSKAIFRMTRVQVSGTKREHSDNTNSQDRRAVFCASTGCCTEPGYRAGPYPLYTDPYSESLNRCPANPGPCASAAHDIQTRAISAAARPASNSDKYQSGFFFTTRQIEPIAIDI